MDVVVGEQALVERGGAVELARLGERPRTRRDRDDVAHATARRRLLELELGAVHAARALGHALLHRGETLRDGVVELASEPQRAELCQPARVEHVQRDARTLGELVEVLERRLRVAAQQLAGGKAAAEPRLVDAVAAGDAGERRDRLVAVAAHERRQAALLEQLRRVRPLRRRA